MQGVGGGVKTGYIWQGVGGDVGVVVAAAGPALEAARAEAVGEVGR